MRAFTLVALGLLLGGCPGRNTHDAGPDATRDGDAAADGPDRFPTLPVEDRLHACAVSGPVDVVHDRHGWPHIYAASLRDAACVQGYLQARDRMPQMELFRRLGSGTLAEAFGALSSALIEIDYTMRTIGLRRTAEAIWAATPPGRTRTMLEGYAEGVSAYARELRSGEAAPPRGTEIVLTTSIRDWTPVDSLTVLRLQSMTVSYQADEDVQFSLLRDRARELFDAADPATEPARAARRGFFWDLIRFQSSSPAAAVPDFYAGTGGGLHFRAPDLAPRLPPRAAADARTFFARLREATSLLGGQGAGSNNWVVAPSHSTTGHALLANDPHLPLISPAILWGSHITVADGPDALAVAGVTIPGVPGVLFGFNRRIAWGVTVAYYDVTDVYLETVTPGSGGQPDTVRFEGREVPLEVRTETFNDGVGGSVQGRIEIVPHHGPVIPTIRTGRIQPRSGATAMSVRWTGHEASREIDAVAALPYAGSVAEAREALGTYGGPPMNFVIADVDGQIGYTSQSFVPLRAPGARSWDPATNPRGTLPCGVLPGTGEAEWTGRIDPALLPHATGGPTRPWIVTANNDPAGITEDNNPVNDRAYLGCRWTPGWRAERIQQRLEALGNRISREDMEAIQADHHLLVGERFRPFIAQAVTRLEQEWAQPGTHPDLAAFAAATASRADALRDAASRLMAWSLASPSGLEPDATDATRRDSAAAMLFHGWLVAFLRDALDDEIAVLTDARVMGPRDERMVAALFLLEHPEQAHTRDPGTGQSTIWDDLRTADVVESRDLIIARALEGALTELGQLTRQPINEWRWGSVHTVRFDSVVPGPGAILSIPPPNDSMYPNGFPRHGGVDSVDVGNPGLSDFDFAFAHGAAQRFTVDMDPAGPRAFTALPGGQAFDVDSPHHRDEAALWQANRSHAIPFTEADVVAAHERRVVFEPAP